MSLINRTLDKAKIIKEIKKMNTTNYQEKTINYTTITDEAVNEKRKTKKGHSSLMSKIGAVSRIAVSALAGLAFFVFLFVYGIQDYYDGVSSKMIYDLLISIASLFIMSSIIWGFMKWCAFILPHSFGWANNMWRAWIALTPFGFVIKVMLWVGILTVPISWSAAIVTPLTVLLELVALAKNNIAVAILTIFVCAALYLLLVALDIAKFKAVKVTQLFSKKNNVF